MDPNSCECQDQAVHGQRRPGKEAAYAKQPNTCYRLTKGLFMELIKFTGWCAVHSLDSVFRSVDNLQGMFVSKAVTPKH